MVRSCSKDIFYIEALNRVEYIYGEQLQKSGKAA